MQIELTEEQQQQILEAADRGREPLRVVNPRTNEAYVLLRADVFEQLKSAVNERFDPREAYPLIDRTMAEDDANDPHLANYQDYGRGARP